MKHMKRSRVQIILEILALLEKGERSKTSIVYQTNLNFRSADHYLENLVEKGLIAWNETTGFWQITPTGKDCHKKLRKSMRDIEAVL